MWYRVVAYDKEHPHRVKHFEDHTNLNNSLIDFNACVKNQALKEVELWNMLNVTKIEYHVSN